MDEYDIKETFKKIEEELLSSMLRNMKRHKAEESKEGINWSMWQAEQLKALEKYRQRNRKKFGNDFVKINRQMEEIIRLSKYRGGMKQETRMLQAIKKGYKVSGKNLTKPEAMMSAEFFRLNERKLEALIKATKQDMMQAQTAVLRMANDQYRKVIFNAQVYANTGAGTYQKAVDMATRDMLSSGLNCVEYKNGARHTLSDYADMAIRTASKRAYLLGEGEKRQEWGISTVVMNKRGNPCPKCLPFVGKVLIDDVWSGGKPEDGNYPLMSTAIASGLYHPRCKDSHTTFFPGISTADDTWTGEELEAIGRAGKKEVEQQYAARQAEKFGRLARHSLDAEHKKQYELKANGWQKKSNMHELTLEETGAIIRYVSPDAYSLNDKLRRAEILTEFEKEWIIKLDKALGKLPQHEGNLNRSVIFVTEDDAKAYFESFIEGKRYSPNQYLSTTKQGIYNEEAQVQIYIQNAKSGKDLSNINDMENEVLYPIESSFKVLNKAEHEGKYFILLEEV